MEWGDAFNRVVGTFLLALRRMTARGEIVTMDPAVLEEALMQLMRPRVKWRSNPDVAMSPDSRSFTVAGRWSKGGWCNSISEDATNDFTVRFESVDTRGEAIALPINESGELFIGFISPLVFSKQSHGITTMGAYALWPTRATLYGTGHNGTLYCPPFGSPGLVRCVADRAAKTISFVVNGVPYGIAWREVEDRPLHAFVGLWEPGFRVQLEL